MHNNMQKRSFYHGTHMDTPWSARGLKWHRMVGHHRIPSDQLSLGEAKVVQAGPSLDVGAHME